MIYQSQLTKRIMKKLEKYGLKFMAGTYRLRKTHATAYGRDNCVGSPISMLIDEDKDFRYNDMIDVELDKKIICIRINFAEPVSYLIKSNVELCIMFLNYGGIEVLEVCSEYKGV